MASSSTSSIQKSFTYDVFLSFRGIDTRKTFVDHLYHALKDKGIRTYKDDEELKKGNNINDQLIRSIQDSKFYIIVFSKDYASSSWCLNELVKIMECQKMNEHTAYPLFYDVEPTAVRHQSGAFGEAFAKHENEEAAWKWREALREAAGLVGWELKNTADGHEAKLFKKIVKEILLELRSINSSVDENLVGMEARVKAVLSLIETDVDDVRMIGIKGMGGGGKTTLATAVFDEISSQFEGKSFVENVREVSKASGLTALQKKVISGVFRNQKIDVDSVNEGKNIMKKMMCGRKVLVVLDDVDNVEQLQALAGKPHWFKSGSIIIITTRYEQVLVAHGVKLIHNVNLLSDEEAICLFNRYAFVREISDQGYKNLSGQVVRYAAGLPLTIKVLGSFLCGKDELEWKDAIERLKEIPLKETLKRLELSYIDLEDDYKELFLDVACLLKGWQKDAIIVALESCGFHARIGLKVLEQGSLITIFNDYPNYECVGMHDHIEEMGWHIVRRSHPNEPNKHSRLWKEDEIVDIMAEDLCTEETRCIKLDTKKLNAESVIKGLRKMKKLRFLHMCLYSENQEINEVNPYFPDALQYLYWYRYPFRSLPQTFQANNLVSLDMAYSKIVQLWEGEEKKVLKKLRFLNLRGSRLRTLDPGLTPNLETLTLGNCGHLVEVPDAIWMLKHLKYLDLNDCSLLDKLPEALGRLECLEGLNLSSTKIKHLPDSICMWKHLKVLELNDCLLLEKLPEDLGHLESLQELSLSSTKIKDLPDSICMLKHLKFLKLKSCSLLEKLPEDLGHLESLVWLSLSSTKIKDLPDSICKLKHLESLKLKSCSLLEKLPEDLGHLESLKRLTLSSSKIKDLPDSICMLKHLKYLELTYSLFEKLPEYLGHLESLQKLELSSTKIKHLPDSICMLKHLKSLQLDKCSLLEKLPADLGRLVCLEKLTLSSTKIKHLPDSICMLKHLEVLGLNNCLLLEKLPKDLGRLECLMFLYLSCTKIKHLPNSICMLKNLKSLLLDQCLLLEKLPEDLNGLECLVELDLASTMIKHIPDSVCMLKHLKSLALGECSLLEKLPEDLGRLECLEFLDLSGTKIRHLPDSICNLKHLRYLNLVECSLLEKLPQDLGRLQFLGSLDLSFTKIRHLPDSICMLYLESLVLDHCSLLEKLPEDLGHLESLQELSLSSTKIKDLPDSICMLKHLISLQLTSCSLLEKLPEDLGHLESLHELSLSSTKIKDLPDSICMLKHLDSLKLKSCSLLEKLPEDLGHLESLQELSLSSTKIKDLPDSICMLKHLESLKLKSCSLLENLPEGLGHLESLWKLTLSSTKIKHLPDSICMLKHLESLKLIDCSLLEKLPENIGQLECLEKLIIMDCILLRDIPNSVCNMKRLSHFYLCYCIGVEKLPEDLGDLECLKELDIEGTSISHLPQSILLYKGLLRIYGSRELFESCRFFTHRIKTSEREEFCYADI